MRIEWWIRMCFTWGRNTFCPYMTLRGWLGVKHQVSIHLVIFFFKDTSLAYLVHICFGFPISCSDMAEAARYKCVWPVEGSALTARVSLVEARSLVSVLHHLWQDFWIGPRREMLHHKSLTSELAYYIQTIVECPGRYVSCMIVISLPPTPPKSYCSCSTHLVRWLEVADGWAVISRIRTSRYKGNLHSRSMLRNNCDTISSDETEVVHVHMYSTISMSYIIMIDR